MTLPLVLSLVLAALAAGGFTLDQRRALAAGAFAHTAAYDIAVASWFASAYAPDETAREVAETLARKGIGNDATREGRYRFLTTGDPAPTAGCALY